MLSNLSNNTPKTRTLVSPNLQAIERKDVTETAKVCVMLRPSERQSIYRRVMERRSTPEAESRNNKVPKSVVLQVIRVERQVEIDRTRREAFEQGYRMAKLEAIRPPQPPAGGLRPSWKRAA